MHVLIKKLLLTSCLMLLSSTGFSQSEVARVTLLVGKADVVRPDGSRAELRRRDPIEVGDVIQTAIDGQLQLRFIDSAIVALRCDTKLEIAEYDYRQSVADRARLVLHSGSLRSIAGAIAAASSRLIVGDTQVQGGEGDFAVAIAPDDTQYFAVFDGTMTISNSQKESKLGIGADADFGRLEPGFDFEETAQYPIQLAASSLNISDCAN